MFRYLSLIFLFLFTNATNYAQIAQGKWRDHFSFNEGLFVTQGNNSIYCASSIGVFSYGQTSGEIEKITKVNGLNDVNISTISYLPSMKMLAIGYENGNIDFVYSDKIINIPYIKDKSLSSSKTINYFLLYDNKIYTATDFGIVVIDPSKEEIKDTYYIGSLGQYLKVNKIIVFDNKFWAATQTGLLNASTSDPLLVNYEHWAQVQNFTNPSNECVGVASTGSSLFALEKQASTNDILWRFDGTNWAEIDRPFTATTDVDANNYKVLVTSNAGIASYSTLGVKGPSLTSYSFTYSFKPNKTTPLDDDSFAIADGDIGMVIGTMSRQSNIRPGGPNNNRVFSIGTSTERVVVASGAYDGTFSNLWYPFINHSFVDEQWSDYSDWSYHDAVVVQFNPKNPNEYYVGSWGDGIFQFNGDDFINRYSPENSTLQTIIPNSPYCRISGLAFDDLGNLWVSNASVENPISVKKTDGTWVSFPYSSTINADKVSTLHYSSLGSLWLIIPRGEGLFVLNPGSNIDSKDDDKYRKIKPTDSNGSVFNVEINALAFDRDNYLWLGTTKGVLLSYNSDKVFSGGTYFQQIKVPDKVEGLAVYLLETESVTAITIDGGNRKWIGTEKSGAYLFSSDGTDEIKHFTTKNSPLPSDYILDIKVHPTSGEVFIATDKGLVSYRGDANEPSTKFGKVYAYPNPVPHGFDGTIVVTGLIENTIVKITDISGNLVYETKSEGGMATWDGKNLKGHRVATGVYLVFCAGSNGEQTAVTKILFIK